MAEIIKYRRLRIGTPELLPTLRAAQAQRRRNARSTTLWLMAAAFVASAAIFSMVLPHILPASPPMASRPEAAAILLGREMLMCRPGRDTCVIDGDTFRLHGQSIRIADIDTPETRDYGCAAEKALGDRATARLRQLLNAGPFEIRPYERDEDVYGRKLRILTRDGHSLGQVLVAEGLARSWDGARHAWC